MTVVHAIRMSMECEIFPVDNNIMGPDSHVLIAMRD